jgi:hypothetical protein
MDAMTLRLAALLLTTGALAGTTSSPSAACRRRCAEIVRSRHDECGHQVGRVVRPDWCAADDERMRTECEASCAASEKK